MRTCPKCKTKTLAPIEAHRGGDANLIPPSRCTRCSGVWLPAEAMARELVPVVVDTGQAPQPSDALPGFCPRCRCLLVRARVEREPPFHLDRCNVCAGVWFDAGEWAAMASSDWMSHLGDLWDPAWRRRNRAEQAHQRHLEELERALGPGTLEKLRGAVEALREHPMRSLGLSFLIDELRGP